MNHSIKILHIFDDEKITKPTIDLFRKLPEYDQTFAVLTNEPKKWQDSNPLETSVRLLADSSGSVGEMRDLIEKYDIIFLQALSYYKAKAINSSKLNKKVFIWGLWGYELYNIVNYFGKQENRYFNTFYKNKKSIGRKLRDFYTYKIVYKQAVKKIDICLFLLEKDFELLSKSIRHDAVWMTGCYQTIENIQGLHQNFKVHGNSILVGNSSTPSNKHEKVFEVLKNADINDRQIIVPLSYGDSEYRKIILNQGKDMFGGQFKPLTEFMDIDSYLEEIKSGSQVIMAHERQQAFGSIMTMLLGGAKVYLSEASPLYQWFKEMGVHIFSFENDLPDGLNKSLNEEEIERNKQILTGYLAEDSVLIRLKKVIETAIGISKKK
jgi:dTDP-N-acetylfucosamine:lipid II N-acetylfucosaminyltransferase